MADSSRHTKNCTEKAQIYTKTKTEELSFDMCTNVDYKVAKTRGQHYKYSSAQGAFLVSPMTRLWKVLRVIVLALSFKPAIPCFLLEFALKRGERLDSDKDKRFELIQNNATKSFAKEHFLILLQFPDKTIIGIGLFACFSDQLDGLFVSNVICLHEMSYNDRDAATLPLPAMN